MLKSYEEYFWLAYHTEMYLSSKYKKEYFPNEVSKRHLYVVLVAIAFAVAHGGNVCPFYFGNR